MESLEAWYKREVYSWRCGYSLGWTLFTQPLVFAVYVLVCNIQVFHPVSWIYGSLTFVVSLHFVLLVWVLTVATGIQWVYSSSTFTVIPEISDTRLHSILRLLRPQSLIHSIICIISGAVMAWVSSNVLGNRYSHLTIENAESEVLNEYNLFLLLYGMYTGLFYQFHHVLHQNNYIQFPVLYQTKYFQVRSGFVSELLSCSYKVFWQTLYYFPLFWFFAHIPRDWIVYNFSLERPEEPLDSIWRLFDVGLFWQTLLCGMFIQFTWSYGALLYKIYQSEHFIFPIESAFEESKNQCLIDALSCINNPMIQHLGYLDLCHLSEHSISRRCEVFSLSQPGGHPHNWNKLCSACLSEINSLNQKLQEANWKVFAAAPVRQPVGDKSGNISVSSVTYRGSDTTSSDIPVNSTKQPQEFKEMILSHLKTRPVFSYFLTEHPDSKSRQVFVTAQIQVWAVEALSNFATASYTEDKYGVVQKSLPEIVVSLVNLLENVEKHFKLATVNRRVQKDFGANDLALRYLLQTGLKRSMYKIVNTFGKHIMSLQLPADCIRKLKQFMEYKE